MKLYYFFFITVSLFSCQVEHYLLPDESNLLIFDIKESIKHSKREIQISTSSFHNRKIFKALRKANNKGVKISILIDKRFINSVKNLAVLKNVEISTMRGLSNTDYKANFFLFKKVIYILPYEFNDKNLNRVYGIGLKIENKRVIQKFKSIFKTLKNRSKKI